MQAAWQCMEVRRPRKRTNTMPCKPYWDQELKDANNMRHAMCRREGVTPQIRKEHNNRFKKLRRAREAAWFEQQSNKWLLLAQGDSKAFWRAFTRKKASHCPVSQEQQLEYFKQLVGLEPIQNVMLQVSQEDQAAPVERTELTGCCLDADFSMDELQKCIKKMKRGKASGHDAVIAEMILDGGECLHDCTLQMYNRMLQGEFPMALSVCLITAVFKKGNVDDMSKYRGITVTPALAKLFAMLLQNRIADYMESNNFRAQGQAGFRRDYRTIDNVFLIQQLLEHY